jgi:hypothetical protein
MESRLGFLIGKAVPGVQATSNTDVREFQVYLHTFLNSHYMEVISFTFRPLYLRRNNSGGWMGCRDSLDVVVKTKFLP